MQKDILQILLEKENRCRNLQRQARAALERNNMVPNEEQCSYLQMAADLPQHYERHMDAFQFIKDVAVDWSESHYLMAEPGDYIIVARKAKGTGLWFLGGVVDEQTRSFEIPLSFLEGGASYEAMVYRDDETAHYKTNPQAYVIEKKNVTAEDSLDIIAAHGGGFAVSFKRL